MNHNMKNQRASEWKIARRGGVLAGIAAALLIAGCGGGGGSTATASSSGETVLRVESAVQPADAAVPSSAAARSGAGPQPVRVALAALQSAQAEETGQHGGPRKVGTLRTVPETASAAALAGRLQWTPAADGGLRAAISFTAQDAYGVRLGVLVRRLPGSALLRVYRQDRPDAAYETRGSDVLQILARNAAAGDLSDAAKTWWTPDTGGSEATLEIDLPAGTSADALDIAIPSLVHIQEDLSLSSSGDDAPVAKNVGDAVACNLDSTCYDDYAQQRNAVARMVFVDSTGAHFCTGTLLNDRDGTRTPYFLTANHCIPSQTVASTLQTDWFFRSSSCNNRTLSPGAATRTGGAGLLYSGADTDTAFLRLNDAPPPGAVFAAWDAGPQAESSAIVGIHHPRGDLQRISFGSIMGTLACSGDLESLTCDSATGDTANYYDVGLDRGTVERGSSGSALFQGGRVIGTLYGFSGDGQCSLDGVRVYGRFDHAYQAALKQWLSPATPARHRGHQPRVLPHHGHSGHGTPAAPQEAASVAQG
ncbi:peptidase S1 [Paracidovorax avenae]|nr:peptidase S1 [Paracidovorax avenae]